MMKLQWSITLIVLSLVHIHALRLARQAVNCPPNVCSYIQCNNGQCVPNNTTADCFQCICDPNYTGKNCDVAIGSSSGCNPPCQNGGICQQPTPNNFSCACSADYTGQQCETSVLASHVCVTNPNSVCQNGGTCTINGAGYLCNCQAGWSGLNCETQDTTTACTPNFCGAHGNCSQVIVPTGVIAYCICEAQWTGRTCEENLSTCPINICQNGGTCHATANALFCTCPSGFTGDQCETVTSPLTTLTTTAITTTTTGVPITITTPRPTITPMPGSCTPTSCSNGGSCFNTGNSFICLCKVNYSGPTCATQNPVTTTVPTTPSSSNACSPNPCNNGGSCYKHANSFVCVCSAAYTGAICDVAKTTATPSVTTPSTAITCANQPCKNGATCYNAGNSYFCYCGANSSFTGPNCDTSKVTADPSCPLDCSPGYCTRTGNNQNAYACMCNGVLTPTSCSS